MTKFYYDQKNSSILTLMSGKESSLEPITANSKEAAVEKHIPVVEEGEEGVTIQVGSVLHPMTEEHSIAWVYLETKEGCQRKNLPPTGEPVAVFALAEGDAPVAAYAYCNLHGFWKTDYRG